MKPSSTERAGVGAPRPGGLSRLPSGSAGVAAAGATVRPARLDRQLEQGMIDPAYSDDHLEELVRQAAEAARESARAEGYAAGWAEGRRAAAQEAEREAARFARERAALQEAETQRVHSLLAALGDAVVAGRRAVAPQWHEVADVLVDGTLQLARAALARELRSIDDPIADAVRQALEAVADGGEALVHLHPEDAATAGHSLPATVRVVPDPAVPAGGVVVVTPSQRLRMDLPAALAAAERVLRS